MWQLLTRVCNCVCAGLLYVCVCVPFKDSFQSESCGPWLTAGLISTEISPIFYLLLNIYSRLNPVSVCRCPRPQRDSRWLPQQQLLATDLHICEIPGILLSLSANQEANEALEVRCQSWRANARYVHHPQRRIKIVTIYSRLWSLNGLHMTEAICPQLSRLFHIGKEAELFF